MLTHLFESAVLIFPVFLIAGVAGAETKTPFTNRLIHEKSPYLIQHAHNPVDWYPWGPEAFQKAKTEGKPVLLSVGYSTCHWCHVMEEESFSDPKLAQLMNNYFVPIKVDREERPDIDSLYMRYVIAATGSGGWPMTVFLTPDKKPFYGGTYFPPQDKFGMPGFSSLLVSIADAWKKRNAEILESAGSAAGFLQNQVVAKERSELSENTLELCYQQYAQSFDSAFGGFGRAPKFPMGHCLSYLLRYWQRSKDVHALQMAEKTLQNMADGGMYDQLGGGFHRYSTDGQWRVPHFEKMLYDQAILSRAYLEAFQATGNKSYARIARETLDFVEREMTAPEGGFYSAQDADSTDPSDPSRKKEGAFYVWKKSQISQLLSQEDSGIFCYFYGIEDNGNALQDPHQEFPGLNVLYRARSIEETADHFKITPAQVERSITASKEKVWKARSARPHPFLDDKVLTDWNGLMIASFAYAARALNEPRYGRTAVRAAQFIANKLKDKDDRLLHRYRDNEAGIAAGLDDHAFLAYGYLELYQTTFEEAWLEKARSLVDRMRDEFWDGQGLGFFMTSKNSRDLIARPKSDNDGALPAGNSVAALDLLLLGRITGDRNCEAAADDTLKAFSGELVSQPTAYAQMLIALDFVIGPSFEIFIAADKRDEAYNEALREINFRFLPNKVIIKAGADKPAVDGKTTVYLCRGHACERPATDLNALKELLDKGATP